MSNNLCKQALQDSIYSHKLSDDVPIDSIILDNYDYNKIKNFIKSSVILLNYNKSHKPIMIEIIDILNKNKDEFFIDQYKYLGFYWNGIPVLRITQNKIDATDRELHISIHRYNKEKTLLQSEKRINTIIGCSIGVSVLVAISFSIMTIMKKIYNKKDKLDNIS